MAPTTTLTSGAIAQGSSDYEVRWTATDDNVRQAIAAFPGMLQRIDDWIEEGVLGGEPPNAADLQIAPSVRLAMSLDDLRPAIEGRPAARLATKIVPHFPGRTPSVLPPEWLKPITAPAG